MNSSSPRSAAPCDAVLLGTDDQPAGSLHLPGVDPDGFIAQFNRIYQPVGLTLRRIDSQNPGEADSASAGGTQIGSP